MNKILTLLSLVLLFPYSALGQNCETGEGNIFNATLLLHESIVAPLNEGESFVALMDDYCAGESFGTSEGATATPLTIWGQDDLLTERNGLRRGETFQVYLRTAAGTIPLEMENDATYIIKSASVDTVLSAVLDALTAEILSLSTNLDNLVTRTDSLQGLVDNFPNTVATLESELVVARAFADSLNLDIATANMRLSGLLATVRTMAGKIED